ncbi:hypothetical protein [Novosphingobium sp.]|uniref:hypothetical protein n=1 Tax=Novosphingobium sp. TaxID=1874826 RepID=UPI003BA8DF47
MFTDPCLVSNFETALFLALATTFGLSIGVGLGWLVRTRLSEQGTKVGCLAMPVTALAAGYLAAVLLPGRGARENCGFTPEIAFFPGYAFIVAPLAMLATLILFHLVGRRG